MQPIRKRYEFAFYQNVSLALVIVGLDDLAAQPQLAAELRGIRLGSQEGIRAGLQNAAFAVLRAYYSAQTL